MQMERNISYTADIYFPEKPIDNFGGSGNLRWRIDIVWEQKTMVTFTRCKNHVG